MTRTLIALVVLALLGAPAAHAQAPDTNAPPGNSAIDEYLETVPGATGAKPPRRPGQRAPSGALTAAQRRQLDAQGPDGRELAAVVDATAAEPAPKAGGSRRTPKEAAIDPGTGAVKGAQARSPVRAALAAAVGPNDGEGLGVLLPVILLTSLLGIVWLGGQRRRRLL
jgi:hypothetical protein